MTPVTTASWLTWRIRGLPHLAGRRTRCPSSAHQEPAVGAARRSLRDRIASRCVRECAAPARSACMRTGVTSRPLGPWVDVAAMPPACCSRSSITATHCVVDCHSGARPEMLPNLPMLANPERRRFRLLRVNSPEPHQKRKRIVEKCDGGARPAHRVSGQQQDDEQQALYARAHVIL